MMITKKIFSFATITLLVALTLSSIAAWYSILGLTAIFAAAVVPIMIMGGSLEIAKVVTTVWLHRYWNRAGWKLKMYLVPAVIALALLTSMGIFGFLSKAHSDQSLVSGDVQAKLAIYDEKINTSKENIEGARKALQQMDAAVDQVMGRSTDVKGATQSVNIRRSQATERKRLQAEIEAEQLNIQKLNEEAAPIRAEVRKVEAEVGPIKYIAALIYGDNPDSNLLERAVRWVIILIVFVFDPLALMLVLAAQSSYEWIEEDAKREEEENDLKKILEEAESMDHKLDDIKEELDHLAIAPNEPELEAEQNWVGTFLESAGTVDPEIQLEFDEPTEPEQPEITDVTETSDEHVVTEGVTFQETDSGYVQFQGKSVSKPALLGMHPELFAAKPDNGQSDTNFGTSFPKISKKGDIFVRVDMLPNRVYKFDGSKWIEVNKELSDSYLYDESYIRYLVEKIETGEYDVELLSENEKQQIEEFLQNQ
jgi:peptidoglycan hydrolase CwlO-like protein